MVQDGDTHNYAEYGMGEITEKEDERVTCIRKIPEKNQLATIIHTDESAIFFAPYI